MKFKSVKEITTEEMYSLSKACCPDEDFHEWADMWDDGQVKVFAIYDKDLVGVMCYNTSLGVFYRMFVHPDYRHKVDWYHAMSLIPKDVRFRAECSTRQRVVLKALAYKKWAMIHNDIRSGERFVIEFSLGT